MIELLIMRHAKSAWDTGDEDFFRPLNSRGERDAPRMASWVAENDLAPDRVLSSAAVRARATALADLRFENDWSQITLRSGRLVDLARPRELF